MGLHTWGACCVVGGKPRVCRFDLVAAVFLSCVVVPAVYVCHVSGDREGNIPLFRDPALLMKNELRVLRAKHNITQAELAEKLGVSRQTINAIETEKYDPSLPLAFKVAKTFGCRIEDVFYANDGKRE